MTIRLIHGDCRAALRELPDQSVHAVITSPPYWGLRSYDTTPQDWGGDPRCAHRWGPPIVDDSQARRGRHSGTIDGAMTQITQGRFAKRSAFCTLCGAWQGELGQEPTFELYIQNIVRVMRDVRRVLRRDGILWLNLGDAYTQATRRVHEPQRPRPAVVARHSNADDVSLTPSTRLRPKNLIGLPWRVALALQADDWWLRSDVIWHKPNPTPAPAADRPTTAHEYLFQFTRSRRYFYDQHAIAESSLTDQDPDVPPPNNQWRRDGKRTRNLRSVWRISTSPFPEAHFATFPADLVEPCIKAGTSAHGCCPSCGAPWERQVATRYHNPGNRASNGPRSAARRRAALGTPGYPKRLEKITSTVGWNPTCKCPPAPPVPCTILDPFAGSGTVGVVADRLGRSPILIDLNDSYLEIAQRRISRDGGMFAVVTSDHVPTSDASASERSRPAVETPAPSVD